MRVQSHAIHLQVWPYYNNIMIITITLYYNYISIYSIPSKYCIYNIYCIYTTICIYSISIISIYSIYGNTIFANIVLTKKKFL